MTKIYHTISSANFRSISYSCRGFTERLNKAGITKIKKEGEFIYFECTKDQLENFRMRMRIYAGKCPTIIETTQLITFE